YADHGDCAVEALGHGVLLCLWSPLPDSSLTGQEHGRTIPLADIDAEPSQLMIERAPPTINLAVIVKEASPWHLCPHPQLRSSTRSCSATHSVPRACGKHFPTAPLSRVTWKSRSRSRARRPAAVSSRRRLPSRSPRNQMPARSTSIVSAMRPTSSVIPSFHWCTSS